MSFKHFLILLLTLSLSGCFAGRKNNGGGEGSGSGDPMKTSLDDRNGKSFDWTQFVDSEESSFVVAGMRATVNAKSSLINKETQQHQALAVDFSVRLLHRGTRMNLFGHTFRVTGFHGEEIFSPLEAQDSSSEITWTELIYFDPLKPQFDPVLLVRNIEGLNASNGSTRVVFEFNPWSYFNSDLGPMFVNRTYQKELLSKNHPDYDPAFDYISYLRDPQTKAPSINVQKASFYINRAETEMIVSDISSETAVKMYQPSSLEADGLKREYDKKNFHTYDDAPLMRLNYNSQTSLDVVDRGDLHNQPKREYVSRDQIVNSLSDQKINEDNARGVKLKLGANLRLQTEISNSDVTTSFETINSGKFRVFAALVGSNQGLYKDFDDEAKILLGVNSFPVVGEINDQILNVEFEMFTNNIINRGDLDLALKVVPLEAWADADVKPFSVVYKLGNINNLIGFGGDFRDIESSPTDFSYEDYLSEVKDFTDTHKKWLMDEGYLTEAHDIIFDSMRIKFRTVKAGETATQRTVIFDVTSCPTEGLSGRNLTEGREFKIFVSGVDPLKCSPQDFLLPDGRENPVCKFERVPIQKIREDGGDGTFKVRNTGCLAWVDEIAHKYYQRENLIERSYHIVDAQTDEEIFKLDGYFNPWDEKFGTLGVDSRNLSKSFIEEIKNREKLPSRFFVGDFSYMTTRFRYDIDENMHLTVKKTVLLNIYPFVKRYSNIINGINGNFPIRDGVYLLKVAYQKDYIDPGANGITLQKTKSTGGSQTRVFVSEGGNQGANKGQDPFLQDDLRRKTFVHVIKKLIRVENNRVITPVEFHIDELRTLRVRSNLLVQLEPVNQYKLQIVNLLERHIAKILSLKIGDLDKARCLGPGHLDNILKIFQKTIDEVALSIPDDINYSSEESFKEVLQSENVLNAISQLTDGGVLEGIGNVLDLAMSEKQVRSAFRNFSAGKLSDLKSSDDLEDAIANSRRNSLSGQNIGVNILEQLSKQASNSNLVSPDDEELYDHEAFITPFNTKDLDDINDTSKSQSPSSAFGTDVSKVNEALNTLQEAYSEEKPQKEIDKHTKNFLDLVSNKRELGKLINNDFTIDPSAAKVSDLDFLVDRKAGIIRRSFVGPLTLLALDNKNVLNATDALDYASCSNDGCQEQSLKNAYGDDFNNDYARNPNFGYQGHFKNCHVDDFIIKDDYEDLIQEAWSDCVSNFDLKPSGEVVIPENFSCDYEKTDAYKKFLVKNSNTIWTDKGVSASPFRRFETLRDEKVQIVRRKNILGPDASVSDILALDESEIKRCSFREVWLKKYFSQKLVKKSQSQFGNFLTYPSVTARVLRPVNEDLDYKYDAINVEAIKSECLEGSYLKESCIAITDKFDVSTGDFTKSLINPIKKSSIGEYYRASTGLEETPYKPALKDFYDNYERSEIKTLNNKSKSKQDKLSKDIYQTLVKIAAPSVQLHPRVSYEQKLDQVAPADFGKDVQEFLCNIMLPRADDSFSEFFEKLENSDPEELKVISDELGKDLEFKGSKNGIYNKFKKSMKKCRVRALTDYKSVEIAPPFTIERKFKTLKLGRYFFRGGKSINFTVSQGVGISHGVSTSNKYVVDPLNTVKEILLKAFGLGSITGGLKFHDYSQTESNGVGDSLGLGTSAHLSMQAAELDLELLEYRRCMLVRWNKNFLKDVLKGEDLHIFQSVIPAMNNIFICGSKENEPIAIRENYYYITQHFTEGDLLDSGSLLNNPWLLNIRGYRDLITFIKSIYPDDENFFKDTDNDGSKDGIAVLNLMKDDLERMTTSRPVFVPVELREKTERSSFSEQLDPWKTMSIGYRNITPAFPGLFTQLSSREVSIPNWPWTDEGQIKESNNVSCDKELEVNNFDKGERND